MCKIMQNRSITLICNEPYYNNPPPLQSFIPTQPTARVRAGTAVIVCVTVMLRGSDLILLNIACTSHPKR